MCYGSVRCAYCEDSAADEIGHIAPKSIVPSRAFTWHYEAGLEWGRLVAAGVFDELPDLQIILGHWGELALFSIERTGAVLDRALDLDRSLSDCARRNLYVTGSGMWIEGYLQRCLDIVGPERLLFSTDFPYQYRPGGEPRRFLENVKLDEATRDVLAYGNWERLSGEAGRRQDRAR